MTSYMVQLGGSAAILEGGNDTVIVEAEDAADAKDMAEFASTIDAADWQNATVTAIAAPADMIGWQLRVVIINPVSAAGVAAVFDATYVGIASDALDDMGDGIAALLNVPYTASYTSATQTLILATGTGTDDLGDQMVLVGFFPPGADTSRIFTRGAAGIGGVRGFVVSNTDQGLSTADLTIVFEADAHVVPSVPVLVKS